MTATALPRSWSAWKKSVKDKSAEITAQQDKLKESQDGVASHSPVSGVRAANLANADAVSEVSNLLRSYGQDAKVALRKFVASFAHVENEQPSGECQLGKPAMPLLPEFDSYQRVRFNQVEIEECPVEGRHPTLAGRIQALQISHPRSTGHGKSRSY